jgi:hypothetical protein
MSANSRGMCNVLTFRYRDMHPVRLKIQHGYTDEKPNSYFGIKILETSAFRKSVVSNEKKKASFASKNSITSCHVLCLFRSSGSETQLPYPAACLSSSIWLISSTPPFRPSFGPTSLRIASTSRGSKLCPPKNLTPLSSVRATPSRHAPHPLLPYRISPGVRNLQQTQKHPPKTLHSAHFGADHKQKL